MKTNMLAILGLLSIILMSSGCKVMQIRREDKNDVNLHAPGVEFTDHSTHTDNSWSVSAGDVLAPVEGFVRCLIPTINVSGGYYGEPGYPYYAGYPVVVGYPDNIYRERRDIRETERNYGIRPQYIVRQPQGGGQRGGYTGHQGGGPAGHH